MILTLDVGNSQIFGGVFIDNTLKFTFRKTSKSDSSSDEFGLFLRSVLKENDFDPNDIKLISICTVVPETLYSLKNCCKKYFDINPFVLESGVKTSLKINYRNPIEVGSDRIANSISAINLFPNKNIIIMDFGTATTFCAVRKDRLYMGGVILAGLKISMLALESRTSKLPSVEIKKMTSALGRSTEESIQSGLYYSHLGAIKEISGRLKEECFKDEEVMVLATGGLANLYKDENIYDIYDPYLVLKGLHIALNKNI